MDLYLKDVIKKIFKLILILIVLILLSPFIVILLPIKMILFIINFFRHKQYYFQLCVSYINNVINKKIFFTHFEKKLISTQTEGYYPRYNITSKHLSYLLEIMNKNKNNEKYSKKILFQMVYFSKFFGSIFNYLSFDSRFEIKESFFSKRK